MKMKQILMQFILSIQFLTLFTSSFAYADLQLNFGVYTSDKPTSMVRKFRPILNELELRVSEKLGKTVHIRLQVASSYNRGIDNLVSGKVDFARIGPASYILSKQRNSDIHLLAMESNNGSNSFFGIICVNENSSLQQINELKGKRFAFGNKHSTIGRFLSQQLLLTNNILADDLAAYEYLGRHDRVGAAVGSNQFDAGALKESAFIKLKNAGIPIRELARIPLSTQPWVASSLVDKNILNSFKDALLNFNNPNALYTLKISGFLPAKDSDYRLIREAIFNNGKFFNQSISN